MTVKINLFHYLRDYLASLVQLNFSGALKNRESEKTLAYYPLTRPQSRQTT